MIPVAFDPTPPPVVSPPAKSQKSEVRQVEERARDYFNLQKSQGRKPSHPALREHYENQSQPTSAVPSPHIAYLEKGRQPSSDAVETFKRRKEVPGSVSSSTVASPALGWEAKRSSPKPSQNSTESKSKESKSIESKSQDEGFRLQEVPEAKKSKGSARSSRSDVLSPQSEVPPVLEPSPPGQLKEQVVMRPATDRSRVKDPQSASSPRPSREIPERTNGVAESPKVTASPISASAQHIPARGDSLDKARSGQSVVRKEVPVGPKAQPRVDTDPPSASSAGSQSSPGSLAKINGGRSISKPTESPKARSMFDTSVPGRPGTSVGGQEGFVASRAPPQPPVEHHRARNESISTLQSEPGPNGHHKTSPTLPRYSAGGEFSLDEDITRILGSDANDTPESFLRRVSNSVRHGRSYSDKVHRLSKENKTWPKSPNKANTAFSPEISSPITTSPEHRGELEWYKHQLKRERQRMIETEKKLHELQHTLEASPDIQKAESEINAKRSTMTILDTQKEIIVRELEVLTEHLADVKSNGKPFDMKQISNAAIRDFVERLQQYKDDFAPQIETLTKRRDKLIAEVEHYAHLKDREELEFNQLAAKNTQLADINNELIQQIQNLHRVNGSSPSQAPSGLGIYHSKDRSQTSIGGFDSKPTLVDSTPNQSQTNILPEEAEPATVIAGPQMVSIRKGQGKKSVWQSRGKNVAKGVTKGVRGVFGSNDSKMRPDGHFEAVAYGSSPAGQEPSMGGMAGSLPRSTTVPPSRQGFGFFGEKNPSKNSMMSKASTAGGYAPAVEPPNVLFGSELTARTEYENASIPGVLIQCMNEVEERGKNNLYPIPEENIYADTEPRNH